MIVEIHYNIDKIKKWGNGKRFYYFITDSSLKRGCNKTLSLYTLNKEGQPLNIGEVHINTAAYSGYRPAAIILIRKIYNYKWIKSNKSNYSHGHFKRKDIQIFELI